MNRWIPEEYRKQARTAMAVVAFGVALVGVLIYLDRITGFVRQILGLMSPFFVGGALAYIQLPIARRIDKGLRILFRVKKPDAKWPGLVSSLISLLILVLLIAGFMSILLPQVISSMQSLVGVITRFVDENSGQINQYLRQFGFIAADTESLNSAWQNILSSASNYVGIAVQILRTSYNLVYSVIFQTFLGLITSFYLLKDRARISAAFTRYSAAILPTDVHTRLVTHTRQANQIFAGFTTGKLLDSLIIGVICYIGMLIMGLEYSLLISVIIGITNILPFFGPFIGAVPSILILLIVNPSSAIKFTIFILVLQQIDGNIIGPKILGDYVGITPLLSMFAIILFGGLFGFVGMLLGVPVAALLYSIFRTAMDARQARKQKKAGDQPQP